MDSSQTAADFIAMSHKFKLGCLETEQQHPHTIGLSDLAKKDLNLAINRIKDLDINTIKTLRTKIPELQQLYEQVNDTLKTGGSIYISGCGATGRLSLVLEVLWRHQAKQNGFENWENRVVSFMAGGDAALIKSVEDFQDHPQFAEQQLIQLGFKENDLLIGSTEGGETWWVIGSVWKATKISKRKPFILYGNSDEILCKTVQRSKQFIESELIVKINMNVGSMAIAGSTRMQSTTILMYGIGLCLLGNDKNRNYKYENLTWTDYANKSVDTFQQYITSIDFSIVKQLIDFESKIYEKNQTISYRTDSYYAISILTDTTERAPTFSLNPFQNINDQVQHKSWCNMILLSKTDKSQLNLKDRVKSDWEEMLGARRVRTLDSQFWKKYHHKVSQDRTLGFTMHIPKQHSITISHPLKFQTSQGKTVELPNYPLNDILSHHVLLKILLNNISTLIMGRLSRYESNVMTYVRASNYKLIDRAARMVRMLKNDANYEDTIHAIYKIKPTLNDDQPIVLKVIEYLNNNTDKKQ